ncbi:MAG: integrase core domain-containing protein [Chloroflexi bacterium]|nr:integrase core domain-containing protein [Chloroflexota bacterium]
MRDNSNDRTVERNYVQKYRFLIREYELVKAKRHHRFRFLQDFYAHHGTNRQTFAKYYNRYRQSGDSAALLPRKRGPRWKSRRTIPYIEQQVLEQRRKGNNRYEIYAILKPKLKGHTPAPSTIYAISRRHGLNKMTKAMQQSKRRIIKTRAGELGHLDAHHLSKDLIVGAKQRYYLVSVVDACTRLAWAEVVEDVKSLSVMFAALKSINMLNAEYGVRFEEIITDNGPEMASPTNKAHHPMERMLQELGIQHRYTRPYRPQTNGKVERFWRTLNEDLIEGTTFESSEELKDELVQYLLYYNTERPHQGLGGKTPLETMQNLSAN